MTRLAWLLLPLLAACSDRQDASAPVDTAPPAPSAPATTTPAADTPAPPGDFATHDVLPPLQGDAPTFTTEPSGADVASTGPDTPILRAVRTGRHEGFDRVVFEFDSDGLPQWQVAYLDAPPADCGSGHGVALAGEATLQVRFSGAAAHTPEGASTSGPRRRAVDLPALRELVRTCDFEAEVTWVLGVAGRRDYRPRVLDAPARLVIDIAH